MVNRFQRTLLLFARAMIAVYIWLDITQTGEGGSTLKIDRLYDAVVAPETWPEALHELARSVDAVGCCIATREAAGTFVAPPVSTDAKAPLEDFVAKGWHLRDQRGIRGWPLFKAGRRVLIEHDITTDEERKLGDYHNDWLRPWDLPWWAAVGFAVDGQLWCLPLLRSSSQGPFTPEEAERIAPLASHLARIVTLAVQLSFHRASAVLDIFDRIACAAFLIDWRGQVVRLNTRAEALVGSGLTLCHGKLRAIDPKSDDSLQRLVKAVVVPQDNVPDDRSVAINRIGRRPLIVKAIPTLGLLADVFVRTRALLLVTDLEERQTTTGELLRTAFGLTPAEARLAAVLAGGAALEDTADELGIGKETARSQLSSVFGKTETHRQSELVALVGRLGRLPRDSEPGAH